MLLTSTSYGYSNVFEIDTIKPEVVNELESFMITVSVSTDRVFYLNSKEIEADSLIELVQVEIDKIGDKEHTTLIIKTDKSVPIEDVVKVMDAANKLEIKAILATDPNAD